MHLKGWGMLKTLLVHNEVTCFKLPLFVLQKACCQGEERETQIIQT